MLENISRLAAARTHSPDALMMLIFQEFKLGWTHQMRQQRNYAVELELCCPIQ